jgi:glycosyltransferase involved in cell wall biosynthesis
MKNGVLVPPINPKAMAESTSKLLLEQKLATTLGEEARRNVKDSYTWTENVRQLQAIYEEFL